MGYYTRFELTWSISESYKPPPACLHANIATAKFCQECGVPLAKAKVAPDRAIGKAIEVLDCYVIGPDGRSLDGGKWYEHEADMVALSAQFPGVLFHLTGEGENNDDIWDLFALDGRIQKHKAKIIRQEAPDPKAWTKTTRTT